MIRDAVGVVAGILLVGLLVASALKLVSDEAGLSLWILVVALVAGWGLS